MVHFMAFGGRRSLQWSEQRSFRIHTAFCHKKRKLSSLKCSKCRQSELFLLKDATNSQECSGALQLYYLNTISSAPKSTYFRPPHLPKRERGTRATERLSTRLSLSPLELKSTQLTLKEAEECVRGRSTIQHQSHRLSLLLS